MQTQAEVTGGIATQSSICLTKFQSISTLAAEDAQLQNLSPSIEDQNDRFKVYIKNMGADREGKSKGSLEYRLRDSYNIRLRVIQFLQSLLELLDDAKCLLDGNESEKLTEMEDILKHLSKTITCLMRLSIVIQSSGPHRRFFQSYDTKIYEMADINHVLEKYNKSDKQLQERIGKANSYRRQYFKYREAHHDRIAYGSAADTDGQSTVATSVHPSRNDEIIHDDFASESSSQATVYDSTLLEFPAIPAMYEHGPFECPFCYRILEADSQKAWE